MQLSNELPNLVANFRGLQTLGRRWGVDGKKRSR